MLQQVCLANAPAAFDLIMSRSPESTYLEIGSDRESSPLPDRRMIKDPLYDYSQYRRSGRLPLHQFTLFCSRIGRIRHEFR